MSGQIIAAETLTDGATLTCDVCVVGSGAGGATVAAGLCEAGLDVILLEEGGYHTRRDFDLQEQNAYPMLYQERGLRATDDGAITILQGRNVGGSTTINWTTCYRTPTRILRHWADRYGLEELGGDKLNPHFEAMEARLNIQEWPEELANENNRRLLEGCRALGYQVHAVKRNVRGCANSGYCGLGCPHDAKQGMLLTTIPDALSAGLRLIHHAQAVKLQREGAKVTSLSARVKRPDAQPDTGAGFTVNAKVFVCSGGAINSPALLLRSEINPNKLVGQHTLLHPVVAMPAIYEQAIEGWSGAPQSIASHQFVDRGPAMGFFMEAPPLQPMLAASGFYGFGKMQIDFLSQLRHVGVMLAICVDGLDQTTPGGTVYLRRDGRIGVSYPQTPALIEAFSFAHDVLARVTFAAGARRATTLHPQPLELRGPQDLPRLRERAYGPLAHSIFTAHQMGGCRMSASATEGVVGPDHRVRGQDNLFVIDGSVLPTALGVNPSHTIYALAHRARPMVIDAARGA